MNKKSYVRQLLFVLLLGLLSALLVACVASPNQEPAPQVEPQEQAQPAEEAAEAEEAAAMDEEKNIEIIKEAGSAKATELEKGVTVVTEETDVSTPRTEQGGEYRDVTTSDAVSFHPYLTTDTASSGYQAMVYSGALLRLDENTLEYIPNMAESYTISEDGLTFTFKLREDMKWSDGQPLTAHDFKWTYDQATKPDNAFPYLSQLEFITGYEALDDYTLEIKIDKIYAPALGQMSGLITPLPKHVWEKLDWSDPEKNPEINQPTVVSGPYKLTEWKRDQYVIFEANENYWYHGAPNISRNTIEIVPDQDIAYQKMKSGETDTGVILPENLEEARQLENITVYEWWPAAARWEYIGLNMREGFPTHDVNVRHGLSHAIDKELLTEEVMLGQAKRLCSVFPETSWVYTADVECYDYDTDKAVEAFAEAGYTFQDGKMLDENGEQLKLKLIYGPNTNKVRELIAVTAQDYLAEIGIEVEVQGLEWSSFLEATDSENPDWDLFVGGWRATIEPHIMYTIFAEENIPELNAVAYVNKEMEALFEEAGGTYDTEFRKEKYAEIQQILAQDAPYIFLYYNKSWSGQNNRIQGLSPTALGIAWNREDWFIEEAAE
ncbi:MAG: ABC transporter substrate-binding protein [Nitrospira sp.]|nr:ABC transporter substrate-binding protein [Nitrospira sp.]